MNNWPRRTIPLLKKNHRIYYNMKTQFRSYWWLLNAQIIFINNRRWVVALDQCGVETRVELKINLYGASLLGKSVYTAIKPHQLHREPNPDPQNWSSRYTSFDFRPTINFKIFYTYLKWTTSWKSRLGALLRQ